MSEPAAERPVAGLSAAVSGIAATFVALLRPRFELATIDFEEERDRISVMLVLVVTATVFTCFALIALSVLIVVLFWDSHPLTALSLVVLAYALIAIGAVLALRGSARPRPFAATLAELERNAEALRRKS